jgi:hypothetical protein
MRNPLKSKTILGWAALVGVVITMLAQSVSGTVSVEQVATFRGVASEVGVEVPAAVSDEELAERMKAVGGIVRSADGGGGPWIELLVAIIGAVLVPWGRQTAPQHGRLASPLAVLGRRRVGRQGRMDIVGLVLVSLAFGACGTSRLEVRQYEDPTRRLVAMAFQSSAAASRLAGETEAGAAILACEPAADAALVVGFVDFSDAEKVEAAVLGLTEQVGACVAGALEAFGQVDGAVIVAACQDVLSESVRAAVFKTVDLPLVEEAVGGCLVTTLQTAGRDKAALYVEAVMPAVGLVIDLVLELARPVGP